MYSKTAPKALVLFLIFFLTSYVGNCVEPFQRDADADELCPIGLPQEASFDCQKSRANELANEKRVFQLESKPFILPLLNMSAREVFNYFKKDPFSRNHTDLYVLRTKHSAEVRKQWLQSHSIDVTKFATYYDIFNFNRAGLSKPAQFKKFFLLPSNYEPFVDIIHNWEDDNMFAEQRVAGNNPMSLRRVVKGTENVGIKWSELRKVLNPEFNWEAAIKRASKRRSFNKALSQGAVYALRYELFDGLPSMPDINESRPFRHMRPVKSPIALFVVRRNKLKPVAIQMDFKQDSPVYTPKKDIANWLLAKLTLQETDGYYGQVVEHLVKVHHIMEPFCVCMYRHLSKMHPLNQLLKYHCRGSNLVNAIGGPTLVTKANYIHQMYAAGYVGTIELLMRKQQVITWKEIDFLEDLKRRGVADKTLLGYYPFRDDGRVIYRVISQMVKNYVDLYYKNSCDISNDVELQAFANEVSADGIGQYGGNGRIKDFPSRITSKKMLRDTLARLIWVASAQHTAMNYPTSDYSALATCVPTKLYDDDRAAGIFSVLNLPNAYIAATQATVAMNIGSLRYDRLFDYGTKLEDRRAGKIVRKYYRILKKKVSPLLKKRNRKRLRKGHLTYPYFIPRWIPNSIQA